MSLPNDNGYAYGAKDFTQPLAHLVATTGSDTVDLTVPCRAIFVGTGGNVTVTTLGGEKLMLALSVGWHPIMLTRIWATGLTAAGIVYGW